MLQGQETSIQISVVIPAYRVGAHILPLLKKFGPEIGRIFVVDDACPEESGLLVEQRNEDPRVTVIRHKENQGVGGAVLTGFQAALDAGADVVVKVDGDGQMDPAQIPYLVKPLLDGAADYTKGNRFYTFESLSGMPWHRIFGNAVFAFASKMTSGYWNLMDPTNGFVAAHADVLRVMRFDRLDKRYFFESDMLFRLGTHRAVIKEVPMDAIYADEKSNINLLQVFLEFPRKYLGRLLKRIFYNYFLHDFNVCSLQIIFGLLLTIFGGVFGGYHWYLSISEGIPATTGTVMLAALPVILGFQLLLSAVMYDVTHVPSQPIHKYIGRRKERSYGE